MAAEQKKYSAKELIDSMAAAEGLSEKPAKAAKADKRLSAFWSELWRREQELLAPPVKTPPLLFRGESILSHVVRPQFALPALAALLVVAVLLWPDAIEPPAQKDVDYQAITSVRKFSGQTTLVHRTSKIEVRDGEFTIEPKKKSGGRLIRAEKITANFDFNEKVDFTIRHPRVTIDVVGTDFFTRFDKESGFINLKEGRLRVTFHPPGKPEARRQFFLKSGQVFQFEGNQGSTDRKQETVKPVGNVTESLENDDDNNDRDLLYLVELKDGEQILGTLISDDEHRVLLITTDGEERDIKKDKIVFKKIVREEE